ncbi:ABC-type branched-chain amino acid transport system, substrate-binding protein [Pseudomonas sp. ok272]|uniref:cytochrome c/ABC transporter substrate-binding protein n=1 Tax=unclassified Pseudomonas TaxID=196821 RepID=UPI0008B7AD0E|nr:MULTISPECIES: ABC transporter substrate-binding protein [unclassified Pseudomonas]SEN26283.1 ABC-type branched-chain amino acid transport system, substrate-binding protein [Pseudomonas sp. ok272]SFN17078.1 ABC-type branched-chain amino acid transport system, substrate-binding protein [Pseudomonas sp. ok602]
MNTALALGMLLFGGVLACAQALPLTPSESAGKRLYREGVSVSAEPIMARVGVSGMLLPATSLPCANCHGADGLGRPEGGVRPPALNWSRLSSIHGQQHVNGRSYPAYSDGTLALAIQEGHDPAGNRLDTAMPRFALSPDDVRNLTAYLKRVTDDRDPGLDTNSVHLGTLLPSQGPLAEEGATIAAVLKGSVARINQAGGIHGRQLRLAILDPGPDRASAEQALGRLIDEQQVFALIAPLVPALDAELAPRLEQAGIPLIGALSLLGTTQPSRQIFDPLSGLREQLIALADYATHNLQVLSGPTLIIYPNAPGQQLAAQGLGQYLQAHAWKNVRLHTYDPAAPAQEDLLPDSRSVFYLGSDGGFSRLASRLQAAGQVPYLFATANQVAGDLLQVPADFSRRVFLAYPFVPSDWTHAGSLALTQVRKAQGIGSEHAFVQVGAFSSMLLFNEGMKQSGRDTSREKLISALEGLHDFATGLTPLISFGPGRRLGLSGAHVVTLELPDQRFYLVAPYKPIAAMP